MVVPHSLHIPRFQGAIPPAATQNAIKGPFPLRRNSTVRGESTTLQSLAAIGIEHHFKRLSKTASRLIHFGVLGLMASPIPLFFFGSWIAVFTLTGLSLAAICTGWAFVRSVYGEIREQWFKTGLALDRMNDRLAAVAQTHPADALQDLRTRLNQANQKRNDIAEKLLPRLPMDFSERKFKLSDKYELLRELDELKLNL